MNAKFNSTESLDPWLCPWSNSDSSPDIIAIGLQEMVDLNAVNVAVENKSSQKSSAWVDRIQQTLNSHSNHGGNPNKTYVCVESKYLVGLMLWSLLLWG